MTNTAIRLSIRISKKHSKYNRILCAAWNRHVPAAQQTRRHVGVVWKKKLTTVFVVSKEKSKPDSSAAIHTSIGWLLSIKVK